INWGDGSTSFGTISGGVGSFTVTGSHTYAEEGSDPVATIITDGDNAANTAAAASTATVADAPLSASGRDINSTNPVDTVVATFTDADPGGMASDYTATITWGDGT